MTEPTAAQLKQLTLSQIASWQVSTETPNPEIVATLPALQRGAVWKPKQVENLWDSLVRGFPVGSFLISPYENRKLGNQNLPYTTGEIGNYTHYLLDGQQRANAIALGFISPLRDHQETALLWVDLEPPKNADDRAFVFRVINMFHPWGFNKLNPENKLSASAIRDAFTSFKDAGAGHSNLQNLSPSKFPLKYAWPSDAIAPIPVAFLWKTRAELLAEMEKLPFWYNEKLPEWKEKVKDAIENEDGHLGKRLTCLLDRFAKLKDYRVPVLPVSMQPEHIENNDDNANRPDHIETLFVRINSGGTPLEGEELIYSIFKSEWPEAHELIEKLGHRLTSPARTIVLAVRLLLARSQSNGTGFERQPPVPNVAGFRRLLRGADKQPSNFRADLNKALFEPSENNITGVFNVVHRFLVIGQTQEKIDMQDFRLHPYLASELARGVSGHETLILLLRWVDRLLETGIDPCNLCESARRRTLGFITALSWFGVDVGKCVSRLWPSLQMCATDDLVEFFNADRFQMLIGREVGEDIILIPPVSADVFSDSLAKLRAVVRKDGLNDNASGYWNDANYYRNSHREALTLWMKDVVYPLWQEGQREDVEAWWIDRVWADRKFVIYAQRCWLMQWFPDYDPTIPGAADTNRPWDYDHIHPNYFVEGKHSLPQFVRRLHWSNGNFRAWPLEANRAVGEASPAEKLSRITSHEARYELTTSNVAEASFIRGHDELGLWCNTVPDNIGDRSYLFDTRNYRESHLCLIDAITKRLGEMYGEWYTSLSVGDLLG